MRGWTIALLCVGAFPSAVQAAPPIIASAAPDAVAVTVYRNPDRTGGDMIYPQAPQSFALIAETRTVTLPPGEVTVRFEGVASGIVPQSAILFGADPRERNRDAALLSQKGLVDAFTGQNVTLRRTDPATGVTVEERAKIRSAADRLVVETSRGLEAIYCSGLNQTLLYPGAPGDLSAKPVLSMTTRDQPGGTVTITLAYITTGFDWDATYVGTIVPSGRSMSVLGWLTLVSADETTFLDATASAVAGKINRSENTRDDSAQNAIQQARSLDREFGCWPAATTSDLAPPPPAPPPMAMTIDGDTIIVTARRVQERLQDVPISVSAIARAENLGDLKLYRIPLPVTVAAKSQKQVAFMVKDRVSGQLVYRSRIFGTEPENPKMLFRFRNRKQDGLGEPLPAGRAILYQESDLGRMYVGETTTPDKSLDEEVELVFGDAANVTLESSEEPGGASGTSRHIVTIRNANPFAITFEIEFPDGGDARFSYPAGKLTRKPGKRVWTAVIRPNAAKTLKYEASPFYQR